MHRLTALLSSLALLAGLFVYAPQSVRAVDPVYIGPGGGSGECSTPDYTTDGSADDVQFNSAVTFMEGDIDNILYVCPGTYDIDTWITVNGPITIASVSGAANTILDATDNVQRIIGFYDDAVVIGLTFQNADVNWEGAAIWAGSALTVRDSIFLNNHSVHEGGAIDFSGDEEAVVTGSTFIGNSALQGGAINVNWDLDLVADSTFTNNEATSGYGGAVYVHWDLYIVGDSEFTGNSASQGGAIHVNTDLDLVADSTFTDNVATEGYGGAIFAEDLDLIESSLFSKNSASNGGGAVFVDDDVSDFNGNGAAGLVSNNFEGNEAQDGGAVQIDDEFSVDAVITRNTFLNNVGDDGGAIDFDDLVGGTISSNKFIGNYATGDGGAIDADDIVSSTVITGNLFSRNTSEDDGGAMWLDDSTGDGAELAVVNGNTFRGNRATGDGGGIYMSFTDTDLVPGYVTSNSFRSNRAGGVGGGIAIMGLAGCAPEITTREAARAFNKNRYTSNQATGSRRTANVGAVPCVD